MYILCINCEDMAFQFSMAADPNISILITSNPPIKPILVNNPNTINKPTNNSSIGNNSPKA